MVVCVFVAHSRLSCLCVCSSHTVGYRAQYQMIHYLILSTELEEDEATIYQSRHCSFHFLVQGRLLALGISCRVFRCRPRTPLG